MVKSISYKSNHMSNGLGEVAIYSPRSLKSLWVRTRDTQLLNCARSLSFGSDLKVTGCVSGAWTGYQAHEMQKV